MGILPLYARSGGFAIRLRREGDLTSSSSIATSKLIDDEVLESTYANYSHEELASEIISFAIEFENSYRVGANILEIDNVELLKIFNDVQKGYNRGRKGSDNPRLCDSERFTRRHSTFERRMEALRGTEEGRAGEVGGQDLQSGSRSEAHNEGEEVARSGGFAIRLRREGDLQSPAKGQS